MSRIKIIVLIIIAIVLIFGAYFLYQNHLSEANNSFVPQPVVDTSSWHVLTDDALGIRIKVPPEIWAYGSQESPGCAQALIFGTSSPATVYLMSEYESCGNDTPSNSNADVGSFQDELSKKVDVVPVASIAEIAGLVKDRIIENQLISASATNALIVSDPTQCELNTLRVSLLDNLMNDTSSSNGTVPVELDTEGCSISPYALTVRYSPRFKKVILFESTFGYSDGGDFYESSDTQWSTSLDQTIYASAEIFK